jgi:hypothetical protein
MEPVTRGQREVREAIRDFRTGRDEMNLVEFPFATLSERAGKLTVLEYQIDEFDREQNQPVQRKLTVTGDAKHGLPTTKDEEVYLGLLQLTKLYNEFRSPVVYFNRLQLLMLLDWPNKDWSYERLATAFHRLTGVRLFYQNSWRDNQNREWCDRGGFGILESFRIRDGRFSRSPAKLIDGGSEFRWSSVIFESFCSGYLKKLDYATVLKLGSTAKRLYRYLDKHFNPPVFVRLAYDLRTLACEHLGLSRRYDVTQIRRYFQPAIEELEAIGFLERLSAKERYRRISAGSWEVVLIRQTEPATRATQPGRLQPSSTTFETAGPKPPRDKLTVEASDSVRRHLKSLSPEELLALEASALHSASHFLRENYDSNKARGGPLFDECRRLILEQYISSKIKPQGS